MKGFELYSWEEGTQWVFSVLVGTNRHKTPAEIQSPEGRLESLEELEAVIASIPAGETATWLAPGSLAVPPEATVQVVKAVCLQHGLELSLAPSPHPAGRLRLPGRVPTS